MPVLLALMSAFGAAFVYWMVRLDGHEVVGAMFSAAARERRSRRNLDTLAKAAARSVHEPRDAALALMIKLGSVDGALLPAAESVIDDAARTVFGFGADLVEHRTFAGYVARNTPTFPLLFRELVPLLLQKLAPAERAQLVDLLEDVADAAGGMTAARQEMIDEVRTRLLLTRDGR